MDSLAQQVREYVAAHVPALAAAPACTLAVSGGGDSVAMVALLIEAGVIDPRRSVIAHFDHRLRDDASREADRRAVEAVCQRAGLALDIGAWDAPYPGEAPARDARYRFLADAARRHAAPVVATAHTREDQAETVLMRLLRGAGERGIGGIAPERPWPWPDGGACLRLVRPLLGVTRADLRRFAAERGLRWHDDPTNADPRYLRNRVRAQLLPALEAARPGIGARLAAAADTARTRTAALDAEAAALAPVRVDARAVSLDRDAVRRLRPELVPYAIRHAVVAAIGHARDIGRERYAALAAAAGARTGSVFELPGGLALTVEAHRLVVARRGATPPGIDRDAAHPLPFSGVLGAWRLEVAPDPAGTLVLPEGACVRGRRPGDRVRARAGHRKLQDEYVDRKVPRAERDSAPVIALGGEVLWSPFVAWPRHGAGRRFHVRAERVEAPPPAGAEGTGRRDANLARLDGASRR
jgi:tRNA(Ile)-lysidine synthase